MLGAHDLGSVDHEANEARKQLAIDHQSSTTRYTVTGWLLFLSSIGGHSINLGGLRSPRRNSSVKRICPASAAEHSRLAVLTVSPITVNSSRRSEPMLPAKASPKLRPMP